MGGGFSKEDNFCADLRRLQQRCGCSDKTCADVLQTFKKYLGVDAPKTFKSYDKKMKKLAGAEMLRLNGCPECKRHVYLPSDKTNFCPHVKADGTVCGAARFDEHGQARESVYYFPLTPRFKALMQLSEYRRMLQHEFLRPKNSKLMSDVYDSPAWKRLMGEVKYPNNRLGNINI